MSWAYDGRYTSYMSHVVAMQMPVYGMPNQSLEITEHKSILKEDSCNEFNFKINNHWGTHVDCPAHFFKNGKKIVDYDSDFWIFKKPQIVDVDLVAGQILGLSEISHRVNMTADILLFRSGWYSHRNGSMYCTTNPGISPEIGFWLRKERPNVRAIGIDWISISSYVNRDLGRQAHRAFLDPDGTNEPVVLVEDMDLSGECENLDCIIIAPWRVERLDSSPCTIIGLFNKDT